MGWFLWRRGGGGALSGAANFSRNRIAVRLAIPHISAVAPSAKNLVPPPDHSSCMASPRPMGRRSGRRIIAPFCASCQAPVYLNAELSLTVLPIYHSGGSRPRTIVPLWTTESLSEAVASVSAERDRQASLHLARRPILGWFRKCGYRLGQSLGRTPGIGEFARGLVSGS